MMFQHQMEVCFRNIYLEKRFQTVQMKAWSDGTMVSQDI